MNAPDGRPKLSFLFLLPVLSCLLAAAHFLRWGEIGLSLACLLLAGLLFWPRDWMRLVAQLLLLGAAVVWIMTTVDLVRLRLAFELDWLRLALILGSVAGFTALSALLLQSARLRRWYRRPGESAPPAAAFLLTVTTLGALQHQLDIPLLLAERFWPGFGWTQVLIMGLYAAWITEKFLDPARTAKLRLRVWGLFSLVFFGQLLIGLTGVEQLLMTGRLHLPVPALIIAGPLYRGTEFFMLFLFGATLLLVGPAWCSYLCYLGAWEGWSSRLAGKPGSLPAWRQPVRLGLLALVILTALGLRLLEAGWLAAFLIALLFGLGGVAVMVFISRRNGIMTHCVTYCPIGLLANWLGRISPFRMRISAGCTNCLLCTRACRYEALHPEDLARQRPGSSCTMCGDCLGSCPKDRIHYTLPGMAPGRAREVFLVLVISLHAVFLAVARI
jgi:ferredoxin